MVPVAFLAARLALGAAQTYAAEVEQIGSPASLCDNFVVGVLVAMVTATLAALPYAARWGISLLGMLVIYWRTKRNDNARPTPRDTVQADDTFLARHATLVLVLCAVTAVVVTLGAHRPDLDDSSFLQIAAQTLRHPERPPLTFDASLGTIMEPFRFAPYRLASYETFVALVVWWTGFDLLTVYYLILPALTAALSIGVAFIFARWFLPRAMAVAAVLLFTVIVLAWGETHVVYGNRVFVRLFQGKGLLVALTTPVTIVAGLMLLRARTLSTWLVFSLTQVAAIGVSSSGLTCALMVGALTFFAVAHGNARSFVLNATLIATALVYPAALALWLKFGNEPAVPWSEVGTFLPINASLGSQTREELALAVLALGVSTVGRGLSGRTYTRLAIAALVLAFNPWLSTLASSASARNLSWRLAWAVPVPLLMAVAASAALASAWYPDARGRVQPWPGAVACTLGLVAFLLAGRWTVAESNNLSWRWPSPKLGTDYIDAEKIASALRAIDTSGTVLASREVSPWLPLLAADLHVVMPGHTYPIMFSTVLPRSEFDDRMELDSAINGVLSAPDRLADLLQRFQVQILILPELSRADQAMLDAVRRRLPVCATQVRTIAGYRIVMLDYN